MNTTTTKVKTTKTQNLKALIAALRSGEYQQGTGALRLNSDDGPLFCCLGVACDLYAKNTGVGEWHGQFFGRGERTAYGFENEIGGTLAGLGDDIRVEYYGLSYDEHRKLYRMNDEGASFETIANFIEQTIIPRIERGEEAE